ncbi:CCAAT/enhancer-binding protein gamma-like [Stylophora pistillata]|uniref:CCAAT/enhancer-binding protein gamma-like n=1 Tax=Stylophora pistillata TaxID=50429 RepID=UPI000C049EEB|nr:CCAAT/enhancer-binding protein gamma-like [Stylophora pistillata]
MESSTENLDTKTSKGVKRPGEKSGDDDYVKKRERNNIAVRKSRMKAKERIEETRRRVTDLTKENEDLRSKVSLLQKELNVLRSLFANGGISVPSEINVQFTNSNSDGNQAVLLTAVTTSLSNGSMQDNQFSSGEILENGITTHGIKKES